MVTATCLAGTDEDASHDLKRVQQTTEKPAPYTPQPTPTEKRSDQYVDEYEETEERIELDPGHAEPQRHKPQLQDEYHEEKTIEYLDEPKAPQAYRFGFEIKDEHQGHQFRHEQKDVKGNIKGRFGYRDAKGQYRQVEYIADDHGFRAKVKTNEAGTLDQNPANVEIEKDKNEAFKDYPQHIDSTRTTIPNTDYTHETGAESQKYHRQPVKEAPTYSDEPGYETHHDQSVNYEAHSRHPYSNQESESYPQSKNEPSAKKVKSSTRRPTTYQYELENDGYSHKHEKRPSYEAYEAPKTTHYYPEDDKEYHISQQEQTIPNVQEDTAKESNPSADDYEEYKNYHPAKENKHYTKRIILPQIAEQHSHSYHQENYHNQDLKEHSYPVNENPAVLKYEYEGDSSRGNKLEYSKTSGNYPEQVPVSHPYIRVVEEPHQSIPVGYEKEPISYGHRQVSYEKSHPQTKSVVTIYPRNNVHHQQQDSIYEERNYEHPFQGNYRVINPNIPEQYEEKREEISSKISSRGSLKYNSKNNEQEPLKKAVLELNADVYKRLIEDKSPGRRIVAIPINQLHNDPSDHSKSTLHSNSGKPHGILHIPLDGESQSTIDLKNLPLVLQIPQDRNTNYHRPQAIYQDHLSQDKHPAVYADGSQTPVVSITKSSGQLNKNKEYAKSKWIPMSPSWSNQAQRKSSHGNNSPVSPIRESPKLVIHRVSNEKVQQTLHRKFRASC
ncbi:hypothetical protein CDAR_367701 [Caerostris darwini]|uniref:Uncharacterized protein n=1 Tax=Caerostris darwini TaxID=1538125 RepID=A0AAV4UAA8_9ARAC|nr:hypothetical protein CDAR_367701 [Caerostris darwini]